MYLVSANAPVVQPGDAGTVAAAHHTFWQSFERGLTWADGPKMQENSTPWPKTMVGNCRTPSDPAVLPQGGRHRIDHFCVRLATRATPARPIYEAPVACSGFRGRRPLVMMVPMTAAVKRKRNVQRQLAWDRTKLCDALAAWKDWERTFNEEGEIPRPSVSE